MDSFYYNLLQPIRFSLYITDPVASGERGYIIFEEIDHSFIYCQPYCNRSRMDYTTGSWQLKHDTIFAYPYEDFHVSENGKSCVDEDPASFYFGPKSNEKAFKFVIEGKVLKDVSKYIYLRDGISETPLSSNTLVYGPGVGSGKKVYE